MVRVATKVIWGLKAQRAPPVAMASLAPKGSQDTPVILATPAPQDTAAQAVQVPKVIPVRRVWKAQKAPKGFKVGPVKQE